METYDTGNASARAVYVLDIFRLGNAYLAILIIIDIFIISSSLLIPSYDPQGNPLSFVSRVSAAMFGFIIVTVAGNIADIYLAGSRQSVQIFIISRKFDEIADMVHSE